MNIPKLKDLWWLYTTIVVFLGGLVVFGSRIQAIAATPEQLEKTSEAVEQIGITVNRYIAAQNESQKRQDQLIERQYELFELLMD